MNNQFKQILVPVDFNQKNRQAISVATDLAEQSGAQLSMVHVIERIELDDDAELQSFYDKLRERAADQFDQLCRELETDLTAVKYDTIIDNRCRGIVSYAVDNDVDLIVMSSHFVDLAHGSTNWATISYQVAAICPCSVMLVKQRPSAE